ncbi:hypothetical protein AAG570_013919 [Ranatra chinensis]|uniref:Triokinase/FMN cyclase n=1 Tax=Ranatra chinensis TaxID=642074 RepID=A0ABD0YDQ9_9HEMI
MFQKNKTQETTENGSFSLNPREQDDERDEIIFDIIRSAVGDRLSVPKQCEEEEKEPPKLDAEEEPCCKEEDEFEEDKETQHAQMTSVRTDTISIDSSTSSIPMKLETEVYKFLLGMTAARSDLMVLEGENVLMRRDHYLMEDRVKLVSGGKWGHDPLFTGYVAKGLLTAVVLGEGRVHVPKPDTILTTLKQLNYNHEAGILVFVLNYLEDRLNFGVAVEMARLEGIRVEMIIVGDDCWESIDQRYGRRGLAGVVLLYKIAGAMAEKRCTLKEIYSFSRSLCSTNVVTISATLGSKPIVGTGLDGSHIRGHVFHSNSTVEDVVEEMIKLAVDPKSYFSLRIDPSSSTVVLINSYTEDRNILYAATKETVGRLHELEVPIARVYSGNFASGKRGFSVTMMREYGSNALKWLDETAVADVWPRTWGLGIPETVVSSVPQIALEHSTSREEGTCSKLGPSISSSDALRMSKVLKMVWKVLEAADGALNDLDPEGCYGSEVRVTALTLLHAKREGQFQFDRPYFVMRTIGEICQHTMPGILGTMYNCLFTGCSQVMLQFLRCQEMTPLMWYQTALGGVNALRSYTKFRTGDATLVDALVPAVKAMEAFSAGKPPLTLSCEGWKSASSRPDGRNSSFRVCLWFPGKSVRIHGGLFHNIRFDWCRVMLQELGRLCGVASFMKVVEAAEAGANSTKFKISPRKKPNAVEVGAQTVCLWLRALQYAIIATR